jgi:molybdate transport system permease protein
MLLLASLPLLLFLAIPLLALILRTTSGDVLSTLFEPPVAKAIQLSIVTTLVTTGVTICAGTPVAYLLARRKFIGRAIVDVLIDLPIVLPPSVAGIALLVAFGRRGLIGPAMHNLGIDIPFTETAVILAQLFVASPFFVKSAAAGFATVDRDLEQAAAIDGASPTKIFWTVTLPLSLPAVAGGAVMTWARALGEFGATIIFAGNFPGRTQTMPLAIYMGFEIDLKVALTLALILLIFSFLILATVKGLLRRRITLLN